MDTLDVENDGSCHSVSARTKNSKHSVKSGANPYRRRSNSKSHKTSRYSAPKAISRTSKHQRASSSSSVGGTPERKRQNETESNQTRQSGRSHSNSSKKLNKRSMTYKERETKGKESNTRKTLAKSRSPNSIFLSNSHSLSQNKISNLSKRKTRMKSSSRINKGKSVKFLISTETGGATTAKNMTDIKRTSPRQGCDKRQLWKGKLYNISRKRDPKSYARIPIRSSIKDQDVHKLPCGGDGKWKYIRMYQERARKREARRRRKRQKEREESGGRKSSRRRKKSRKSKRRSKSRSRSKSKRRKSKSRRRSAKSSTRRRRRRSR